MKIKLSIAAMVCALLPAIPLVAANGSTAKKSTPGVWPAESLSGKIIMVDPDHKLVVVKTPDGVPFDMDISAKTRIRSGNQSVALKDLMKDINKPVSVEFVPERRGDMAKSIKINS